MSFDGLLYSRWAVAPQVEGDEPRAAVADSRRVVTSQIEPSVKRVDTQRASNTHNRPHRPREKENDVSKARKLIREAVDALHEIANDDSNPDRGKARRALAAYYGSGTKATSAAKYRAFKQTSSTPTSILPALAAHAAASAKFAEQDAALNRRMGLSEEDPSRPVGVLRDGSRRPFGDGSGSAA